MRLSQHYFFADYLVLVPKQNVPWSIDDDTIEEVLVAKYLGVKIYGFEVTTL